MKSATSTDSSFHKQFLCGLWWLFNGILAAVEFLKLGVISLTTSWYFVNPLPQHTSSTLTPILASGNLQSVLCVHELPCLFRFHTRVRVYVSVFLWLNVTEHNTLTVHPYCYKRWGFLPFYGWINIPLNIPPTSLKPRKYNIHSTTHSFLKPLLQDHFFNYLKNSQLSCYMSLLLDSYTNT